MKKWISNFLSRFKEEKEAHKNNNQEKPNNDFIEFMLKEHNDVKVIVYNKPTFDSFCERSSITDKNVENQGNMAFISIVGTDKSYDSMHWFTKNHDNVINLEFDDVDTSYSRNGHSYQAMTQEQAQLLFNFIEKNIGRVFYIHCDAGVSRSQAVASFIRDFYKEYDNGVTRGDRTSPYNAHVRRQLARSYYKKNNIYLS